MVSILAILQNWLNFLYQDYANNLVDYLKNLRDLDDNDEITKHLRSITTLKPKAQPSKFNLVSALECVEDVLK